ncbi:hypothetical protein [Pseudomonas asiatica]|uniref:hypothetical protein n=1 Tax=Pseudomonas asiatica TaxID=2219225 RepID=UPI002AC8E7C6|nr:hypothetical protein [Pseudomonas asiatica]WPX88520.1 hypothetical protein PsasTeo6_21984 [Pseudomonas asiatica]
MRKDGKDLERLVQMVEKSLAPSARVEHDIQMPILTSKSGATAQCDIVIWEGAQPRQFVTIIEVQDRRSQVKINDFRGWIKKREQVGAQRLICVSRKDFPQSIKEEAALQGGSVLLIVLRDIRPDKIPLNFVSFTLQYRHFEIESIDKISPEINSSELLRLNVREEFLAMQEHSLMDKIWSLDGRNALSLFQLCSTSIDNPGESGHGVGKLRFPLEGDPPIFSIFKGLFIRSGLSVDFLYSNQLYSVPMSVLAYEQDDHGTLAWVMRGQLETPQGSLRVQFPIRKSASEEFIMRDDEVCVQGLQASKMEVIEAGSRKDIS